MFNKLEKFLFLALVFSIPFQKRIFLFGPSPEGEGFFEWTSGFLYFTDILIIALAIFWFVDAYPKLNFGRRYNAGFGPIFLLFAFLGLAFISITQAELVDVGAYRFIKLGEFIFLFFYVASRARDIGIKQILQVFAASGVFQSVIAILQFAKQSSLGLHIFHESTLEIGMRGVAQITGEGAAEMIRAYGTFTNPNVLAGFLGICLIFLFYLYLRGIPDNTIPETFAPPARVLIRSSVRSFSTAVGNTVPAHLRMCFHSIIQNPYVAYGALLFLLSFGLLLTFSRGVIIFFIFTSALFFGGIFTFKKFQQYKMRASRLLLLFVACCVLLVVLLWPEVSSRFLESSASEPAISERLFFNAVGVETTTRNYMSMFFGIGIGNFVSYYMEYLPGLAPYLYQPVHNIFILIASEIGALGLIAFIIFLAFLIGRAIRNILSRTDLDNLSFYTLLCVAGFMLLISMYDHYFWTLQQGGLMFWMSLGLLVSLWEMSRRQMKKDKL